MVCLCCPNGSDQRLEVPERRKSQSCRSNQSRSMCLHSSRTSRSSKASHTSQMSTQISRVSRTCSSQARQASTGAQTSPGLISAKARTAMLRHILPPHLKPVTSQRSSSSTIISQEATLKTTTMTLTKDRDSTLREKSSDCIRRIRGGKTHVSARVAWTDKFRII